MIGPGKYDELCSKVREDSAAAGAMIVIFDGNLGSGFSCQLPLGLTLTIPSILRRLADDIEINGI